MDRNRYRVSNNGMRGGFGSVTEIHDRYLDRDLLYKSIHNPANNDQLLTEVAALTRVRSPHIIEIYDIDLDDRGQLQGIIIEKLQGRDYYDFYTEAASSPTEYLKTVYQIACAITDLHGVNIIHRDLKLTNFKASEAGILKLFDFGISSIDGTRATIQNRGTVVYAAPELYQDNAIVTRASDVYSLGICCWTLATNELPSALQERPPQSISQAPSIASVAAYIPAEIANLIDACIAQNPALRPTAAQVALACKSLLLKNQHRGLFFSARRRIYELSAQTPTVRIATTLGELRAAYTGTNFTVTGITGDVFINNQRAVAGTELFDACVLTFGDFASGRDREFISFFCSKPEIVL